MHKRKLLIGVGVLATLMLLGAAGYVYIDHALQVDASMHADFNSTAQDAMEEGTFIRYVDAVPDTLQTAAGRLRFGRAWIHEDSHVAFRWGVQRRIVREGTYRLCFNLAEGEPGPGMSLGNRADKPQWIVDTETGLRYEMSSWFGEPWRYCRPVTRPFPARVSMAAVMDDSLRARMQDFAGTVHPPAPAATRHEAQATVQADGRTMLLTHTQWNGFAMLWISERESGAGSSTRWRVRRVLDYPGEPVNYGVRYGTCARPGKSPAGTLVLERLHPPRDINSAWRVDAATADLTPVAVDGLTCRKTEGF